MKNKLRSYQVRAQSRVKQFVQTKGGALIIMPNAVFLAFMQRPCEDTLINWIHVVYIIVNSLLLMFAFLDVRIVNFLKMFVIGGATNIITKEAIALYGRYFGGLSKKCSIPIYINDLFTLTILSILFVGAFIWAFKDEESNNLPQISKTTEYEDFK